jgi:hypothetical protein
MKLQDQDSKDELQRGCCPETGMQQAPNSHADDPESTVEMIERLTAEKRM